MEMRQLLDPLFLVSFCTFIAIYQYVFFDQVSKRLSNFKQNQPDDCCHSLEVLHQQWRHLAENTRRLTPSFQRVTTGDDSDNSTDHLFSAYLDDRPTPDLNFNAGKQQLQLPVVRVFSVLRRGRNVTNWRCFFFSKKIDFLYSVPVASWNNLNNQDTSLPIISAMLLCPVNGSEELHEKAKQSHIPSFVSIGASCNSSVVRNLLPIVDLPQRRRRLKQNRNDTSNDNRFVKFAVCVAPPFNQHLFKSGDFVEFIEVNRLFGVEMFFFHVEPSASTERLMNRLERYQRIGVVEWIPWTVPEEIASKFPDIGRITAINDCMYRSMYQTSYIVNQDLDELIVPTGDENWHQMIDRLNERQSHVNAAPVAFSFRNQFHSVPLSGNQRSPDCSYKLDKFISHTAPRSGGVDRKVSPHTDRSKVMFRPEALLRTNIHVVFEEDFVRQNNTNATLISLNVGRADAVLYNLRFQAKLFDRRKLDMRPRLSERELRRRLTSGLES